MPLSQLALGLGALLQQIVVDRTGLDGNYDLDLTWTFEPPPPGTPLTPASVGDLIAPALLTAVQDELGLKLPTPKGPVNVLIVDSVEPPTNN